MIDQNHFQALNQIGQAACADAEEHGLWGSVKNDVPSEERRRCACLVLAEAGEAMNAAEVRLDYQEELADVVIVALSAAAYLNINIGEQVERKMRINRGRPYLHGKG